MFTGGGLWRQFAMIPWFRPLWIISPILSSVRALLPTDEHSVLESSWSLTADARLTQRPFELTLCIPSSGWQSLYAVGLRIALHTALGCCHVSSGLRLSQPRVFDLMAMLSSEKTRYSRLSWQHLDAHLEQCACRRFEGSGDAGARHRNFSAECLVTAGVSAYFNQTRLAKLPGFPQIPDATAEVNKWFHLA